MDNNITTQSMWLIAGIVLSVIVIAVFIIAGGWNLLIDLIFKNIAVKFIINP